MHDDDSHRFRPRPTVYGGIRMRSRLEARVAERLDAHDINWRHEPECYASPAGQYLPDFGLYLADAVSRPSLLGGLLTPSELALVEVRPEWVWRRDGRAGVDATCRQMEIIWASEPRAHLVYLVPEADRLLVASGADDRVWRRIHPCTYLDSLRSRRARAS